VGGDVAQMGERSGASRVWRGRGCGRKETTFRALGVDYRIILKEILKK